MLLPTCISANFSYKSTDSSLFSVYCTCTMYLLKLEFEKYRVSTSPPTEYPTEYVNYSALLFRMFLYESGFLFPVGSLDRGGEPMSHPPPSSGTRSFNRIVHLQRALQPAQYPGGRNLVCSLVRYRRNQFRISKK